MIRRAWIAAIATALAFLVLGIRGLGDFGPTWDLPFGEYPYGETVVGWASSDRADFLDAYNARLDGPARAPHPDFSVGRFPWHWVYPFAGTLSALGCRIFWTELGWLPPLAAHNLVIVVAVACLLLVMVRFVSGRFGIGAGIASALFLVLCPRFLADSFNNLKDVPEACLYFAAVLAGFVAFTRRGLGGWSLCGALTACALATKANALFIPVQLALLLLAIAISRRRCGGPSPWSWSGFALAVATFGATYFAVSPAFWHDTPTRLKEHFTFIAGVGNVSFHDIVFDNGGLRGLAAISFDAVKLALWTTPPVMLALACLGVFHPRMSAEVRALLLLGVAVPIGRTLLPGMINYDGVRHFLEFLPPLAILAALGLDAAVRWILRVPAIARSRALAPAVAAAASVAAFVPGAYSTVATYPNGTCYFNFLVGGLRGAQRRGLPDATDYWGNSYWQGLDWLDRNAERGAALLVPLAGHIVDCAAPVRLRRDLRLLHETDEEAPSVPLYVMYVTRWTFYGPFLTELDSKVRPVHEIVVQGGPVLRIARFDERVPSAAAVFAQWRAEALARRAKDVLENWLAHNPEERATFVREVDALDRVGKEETLGRLKAIVPASMHRGIVEVAPALKEPR